VELGAKATIPTISFNLHNYLRHVMDGIVRTIAAIDKVIPVCALLIPIWRLDGRWSDIRLIFDKDES
jgi:hypothetical protein